MADSIMDITEEQFAAMSKEEQKKLIFGAISEIGGMLNDIEQEVNEAEAKEEEDCGHKDHYLTMVAVECNADGEMRLRFTNEVNGQEVGQLVWYSDNKESYIRHLRELADRIENEVP